MKIIKLNINKNKVNRATFTGEGNSKVAGGTIVVEKQEQKHEGKASLNAYGNTRKARETVENPYLTNRTPATKGYGVKKSCLRAIAGGWSTEKLIYT